MENSVKWKCTKGGTAVYELMDKGFILICCLSMGLMHSTDPILAVPFLIAVASSAANSFKDSPWLKGGGLCLILLLSLWEPSYLFFVPLCLYDIFLTRQSWFALLLLPPLILAFPALNLNWTLLLLLFSVMSVFIKLRSVRHHRLTENYNRLRDSTAELSIRLENTNRELRLHQDEQVHTAMLKERNRIAREIHDNVGHLLSSAMLQLGALLAISKTEAIREPLLTLKGTLSDGMNSIRQSVHGLHDESVDLQEELQALVRGFTFCRATLDYDMETNPDRRIKYAFVAVVKEALSNVAKHSSATQVSVAVREHPALYQLDIRDNGKDASYHPEATGGIGIANMTSRVTDLNGRILITADKGFHIFISVPKEVHP
jgi:signal transduction histidine kinase